MFVSLLFDRTIKYGCVIVYVSIETAIEIPFEVRLEITHVEVLEVEISIMILCNYYRWRS